MTVAELIEALSKFPGDAPVVYPVTSIYDGSREAIVKIDRVALEKDDYENSIAVIE